MNSMNEKAPMRSSIDSEEIDLMQLVGTVWDGRWIIIACTVAFTFLGVCYALLATPQYQADAMLQVEEKSAAMPGLSDIGEMFGTPSAAVTEIELLKSRAVMGETVADLHLDIEVSPNRVPLLGGLLARRASYDETGLAVPWWNSNYAWGGEELEITRFEVPESTYGTEYQLLATEGGWTLLNNDGLELLKGKVGERATAAAYTLFVKRLHARPGSSFTVIKHHTLPKILALQGSISASEKGRESGIIVLKYQDSDPQRAKRILNHVAQTYVRMNVERNSAEASQSLEFLRSRLPSVRKDLEEAEQKLNEYQVESESVDVTAEGQALLDQIIELEKSISELQMQKAEIDRKFKSSHPTYQAWERQMAELAQRRKELDRRVSKLPITQQKVVRLTRDVKVGNEIYLQMLANVQELDIVRAGTVGNVRVVDEAVVNASRPVAPNKSLIVVISFLLGGLLSVAGILIRAAFNRGIETPDQLEAIGLPVYATVPLSNDQQSIEVNMAKGKARSGAPSLLAVSNPADLSIEALRGLRTSIHFAMMGAKNNVLMISGPSPGVGKSFVSVNFASIFATSGKRILVVDADLRRGHLHQWLTNNNDKGLSEALSGKHGVEAVIQDTVVEGLDFVSRGASPPNPSELLMAQSFESFIDHVKGNYDLVIIDTPPILAVTDAAIVGRHAGTSMIITRYGLNSVREVEWTISRFKQNGVEVKGAVLNAVERKAMSRDAYSYYGYQYK